MAHSTVFILATLFVLLWCLIGTALLNHLPLLSDPRLHRHMHHGLLSRPLLIVVLLIVLWPAGKPIGEWWIHQLRR